METVPRKKKGKKLFLECYVISNFLYSSGCYWIIASHMKKSLEAKEMGSYWWMIITLTENVWNKKK